MIQRKPGWDPNLEKYKPVYRYRPNPDAGIGAKTVYIDHTKHDQFGIVDECHMKDLKPLKKNLKLEQVW